MFELDTGLIIGRVVYRIIRSLKDPKKIEEAVRQILPQVSSLSSKMELITDIGYREGAGHKLVSEAVAEAIEKKWRDDVRAANEDALAKERKLLYTLLLVIRESKSGEPPINIPESTSITQSILKSARSESLSQTMGSYRVKHKPYLAWGPLLELYGDEKVLRQRIDELKASEPDDIGDVLELAEKHLSGWRPDEYDSA